MSKPHYSHIILFKQFVPIEATIGTETTCLAVKRMYSAFEKAQKIVFKLIIQISINMYHVTNHDLRSLKLTVLQQEVLNFPKKEGKT